MFQVFPSHSKVHPKRNCNFNDMAKYLGIYLFAGVVLAVIL